MKRYSSQTEMERNLLKGEVRATLRTLAKYYYDEESEKYKINSLAYNEIQQEAHKVLLETLSDLQVECIDNEDRKLLEDDFNQAVNDFDENVTIKYHIELTFRTKDSNNIKRSRNDEKRDNDK